MAHVGSFSHFVFVFVFVFVFAFVFVAGEDAHSKAVNVFADAAVGLVESIGDSRQLGMETV